MARGRAMQFSPGVGFALRLSELEAQRQGARNVEPIHLFVALLRVHDGAVQSTLRGLGQESGRLLEALGAVDLPPEPPLGRRPPPQSIGTLVAIRRAEEVARVREAGSAVTPLDLLVATLETADRDLRNRLCGVGFDPESLARAPEIEIETARQSRNNEKRWARRRGGFMFEKFTERARKVMSLARQEAQRLNAEFIGTEHILLAIIQEGGGVGAKVLKNLNVDLKRIRQESEKLITPTASPAVFLGQLPFSPRSKRVIELAGEAASQLGHDAIGTEHLLLGLLQENGGIAAQVLTKLGLKLDEVRDMVLEVLGADIEDEAPREATVPQAPIFYAETRLATVALLAAHRHLVDRPILMETVVQQLLAGRNVAIVGPQGIGRTSLVLRMARAKTGDLTYFSVDCLIFDPFKDATFGPSPNLRLVRFVPQGEILTGCHRGVVERLFDRTRQGERLILEFEEGGLAAFAGKYPELAKELAPVKIDPPGEAESWQLLHFARTRLLAATGFSFTDHALREANRLAAERIGGLIAPWSTIRALWKAASIEEYLRFPEESRGLYAEIAELERVKDEAISLQEFEKAAQARDEAMKLRKLRDKLMAEQASRPFDPHLSMEAIEKAIDFLARTI